ncbi:hypothetical protein ACIBSV_03345 [Embleya sp. NPDC050154]|uniref:hypothetical protein n=1 Tax=unclassified Embleya TaxID=2699296 RepID=UPI0037992AD0
MTHTRRILAGILLTAGAAALAAPVANAAPGTDIALNTPHHTPPATDGADAALDATVSSLMGGLKH